MFFVMLGCVDCSIRVLMAFGLALSVLDGGLIGISMYLNVPLGCIFLVIRGLFLDRIQQWYYSRVIAESNDLAETRKVSGSNGRFDQGSFNKIGQGLLALYYISYRFST